MKQNGFTLFELLVALTVASILVTVGIPNLRAMVLDNRLISQANDFVATVNVARSAAVRYQRPAIICTTDNFDAEVPVCSGGTDWSGGWVVWVDKNRDGLAAANEIVAVNPPVSGSVSFTSVAADRFVYDARGFGITPGDSLSICDGRTGETGRVVRVNDAGRVHIAQQGCS